jgi:hypothetical protein
MRFAEIESCRETKIVIEPAATDKLRILDGSGAWRSSETMAQQALQGTNNGATKQVRQKWVILEHTPCGESWALLLCHALL